jgi:hypothetical protein
MLVPGFSSPSHNDWMVTCCRLVMKMEPKPVGHNKNSVAALSLDGDYRELI